MGHASGNGKVAAAVAAERERLRREDHLRVKHDKLFSDWKILVGPADWKDHAASEEGSQRYRIHNLPAAYFGPGVYELGLTTHHTTYSPGQDSKQRSKLRRHAVVVVYLGQADNVRHRLQRYGQTGSHLEGSSKSAPASTIEENVESHSADMLQSNLRPGSQGGGLRLFTEVFSRGYSIAFRWARTESKQVAERVESELLRVFDYPWNTALNGARRPRDILVKLEMLQYHLEKSVCLGGALGIEWRKWEYLGSKVGIAVAVRKPTADNNPARPKPSTGFLSSIKAGQRSDTYGNFSTFCGMLLDNGSTCTNLPIQGRRRCSMHKGLKAKLSTQQIRPRTSVVAQDGNVKPSVVTIRAQTGKIVEIQDGDVHRLRGKLSTKQIQSQTSVEAQESDVKPSVVTIRTQVKGKRVEITNISSNSKRVEISNVSSNGLVVCGAIVDGGSPCLNLPVQGRKRCADHKGMHIRKPKFV